MTKVDLQKRNAILRIESVLGDFMWDITVQSPSAPSD